MDLSENFYTQIAAASSFDIDNDSLLSFSSSIDDENELKENIEKKVEESQDTTVEHDQNKEVQEVNEELQDDVNGDELGDEHNHNDWDDFISESLSDVIANADKMYSDLVADLDIPAPSSKDEEKKDTEIVVASNKQLPADSNFSQNQISTPTQTHKNSNTCVISPISDIASPKEYKMMVSNGNPSKRSKEMTIKEIPRTPIHKKSKAPSRKKVNENSSELTSKSELTSRSKNQIEITMQRKNVLNIRSQDDDKSNNVSDAPNEFFASGGPPSDMEEASSKESLNTNLSAQVHENQDKNLNIGSDFQVLHPTKFIANTQSDNLSKENLENKSLTKSPREKAIERVKSKLKDKRRTLNVDALEEESVTKEEIASPPKLDSVSKNLNTIMNNDMKGSNRNENGQDHMHNQESRNKNEVDRNVDHAADTIKTPQTQTSVKSSIRSYSLSPLKTAVRKKKVIKSQKQIDEEYMQEVEKNAFKARNAPSGIMKSKKIQKSMQKHLDRLKAAREKRLSTASEFKKTSQITAKLRERLRGVHSSKTDLKKNTMEPDSFINKSSTDTVNTSISLSPSKKKWDSAPFAVPTFGECMNFVEQRGFSEIPTEDNLSIISKESYTPSLTEVVPFNLSTYRSEPKPKPIDNPTFGEYMNSVQEKGFRGIPTEDSKWKPGVTIPNPPKLSTPKPKDIKSQDQIDEELMEEARKNPFKARPAPRGMELKNDEGHPIAYRQKVSSTSEIMARECEKQFHARPMPDLSYQPLEISSAEKKTLTTPKPFRLYSSEPREIRFRKKTPSSMDRNEAECARQFKAKPMPDLSYRPPSSSKSASKSVTTPEPFKFAYEARSRAKSTRSVTDDEIELSKKYTFKPVPKNVYRPPKLISIRQKNTNIHDRNYKTHSYSHLESSRTDEGTSDEVGSLTSISTTNSRKRQFSSDRALKVESTPISTQSKKSSNSISRRKVYSRRSSRKKRQISDNNTVGSLSSIGSNSLTVSEPYRLYTELLKEEDNKEGAMIVDTTVLQSDLTRNNLKSHHLDIKYTVTEEKERENKMIVDTSVLKSEVNEDDVTSQHLERKSSENDKGKNALEKKANQSPSLIATDEEKPKNHFKVEKSFKSKEVSEVQDSMANTYDEQIELRWKRLHQRKAELEQKRKMVEIRRKPITEKNLLVNTKTESDAIEGHGTDLNDVGTESNHTDNAVLQSKEILDKHIVNISKSDANTDVHTDVNHSNLPQEAIKQTFIQSEKRSTLIIEKNSSSVVRTENHDSNSRSRVDTFESSNLLSSWLTILFFSIFQILWLLFIKIPVKMLKSTLYWFIILCIVALAWLLIAEDNRPNQIGNMIDEKYYSGF